MVTVSAAALDLVVDCHDDMTARCKGGYQHPKQEAVASPRVLPGTSKDVVDVHEFSLLRTAHNLHKARAARRAGMRIALINSDCVVMSGAVNEQRRERQDALVEAGRQR